MVEVLGGRVSPDGLAGARVHHAASAGRMTANRIRVIS